jgi:hypothetical protein
MAENQAYKALRRRFPYAHWQRLETWTGTGIFDANACLDSVESWVECKEAKTPKTSRGLIQCKVRPAQVAWEFLRRASGGRTFVALYVYGKTYLLRGEHIGKLKKGVTQKWLEENQLDMLKLFSA